MAITLSAAYSRLAQPTDVTELGVRSPAGFQLSQHQIDTYRILMKGKPGQVVFNTALTGDGKSLASMLPTLNNNSLKLFAMFPTNELMRDQFGQVARALKQWTCDPGIKPVRLDAEALDERQVERGLKMRADALRDAFSNGDIVLTNPDIFHYILQAYYTRPRADAPDKVFAVMLQHFTQFTFDEFHIFQTPQIVAVTNTLMLIRETMGARCPRILFLSATPNPLMLRYFERAKIDVALVNGTYTHGTPADTEQWRLILRQARLTMHAQRVEEWVDAHLEDTLLPFFLDRRPNAKGALIVNSVIAAQRLTAKLRPILAQAGLSVESNTGLDTRAARDRSYSADLLIGTSTVDIGVDFKINFLVFESRDGGSFIQRLGRLGRHNGYERDGTFHAFDDFAAHALVPNWVHESLFLGKDGSPPQLVDETELDRQQFANIIRDVFPQPTTFESYGKRWGGLQAAHICWSLSSPLIRDSYADIRRRLEQLYQNTLGVSLKRELWRLKELRDQQRPLHDEVLSFRGGGLFECGVIDEQASGFERMKTYELFTLVENFNLDAIDLEAFFDEARRWGMNESALKRKNLMACFRTFGMRDERARVEVLVNKDLDNYEHDWFDKACTIDGIEVIVQPAVTGLTQVNRGLRQRKLPACLSRYEPRELAIRLRLPAPFPIHRMHGRGGDPSGSIAFGREALLLDVAIHLRPDLRSGPSAIIA